MDCKYTHEALLDDIQNDIDEKRDKKKLKDSARREGSHKRIVMQALVKLAQEYGGTEYADDKKLRNSIEAKLNKDELLSGFLFFVSQNPQFDYSWNYLRNRKNSYADYLFFAIRFINNVVADVNTLAEEVTGNDEIHVVIHGFFDIALGNVPPYVKISVKWENFQQIAIVKKEYIISVNIKDKTLATGVRIDAKDVVRLMGTAKERLSRSKIVWNESSDETER